MRTFEKKEQAPCCLRALLHKEWVFVNVCGMLCKEKVEQGGWVSAAAVVVKGLISV